MSATVAFGKSSERSMVGKAITVIKYFHACFASNFPCATIFRFDALYGKVFESCWRCARVQFSFPFIRVRCTVCVYICVCVHVLVRFLHLFSFFLSFRSTSFIHCVCAYSKRNVEYIFAISLLHTDIYFGCYHLPVNIYVFSECKDSQVQNDNITYQNANNVVLIHRNALPSKPQQLVQSTPPPPM